jgi:Leucine-rich repeat (LRR) protein
MRTLAVFGVLVTIPFAFAHAQIPAAERAALIKLYNDTDGPNWLRNDNWLGPVGQECDPALGWYGVTCVAGHVDELYLVDNLLDGPIPSELSDLTEIRFLLLKGNNLTGTLPPELGTLSNLVTLHLFNNDLTGEIPPEYGGLSNLESLWLPLNRLSGEIPPELGDLTSLRRLYLYDNQLTGEIPPELGNLANLEWMFLYNNQLSGNIPSDLGDLSNLEKLNLNSNRLSGEIPVELADLSNLQELILFSNMLTGEIPPDLWMLSTLLQLDLGNNLLTGTIPTELGSLPVLRKLFLNDNQLEGDIPTVLGDLQFLRQLDLARNQLTGEIPAGLGTLTALERLYLQSNKLTGLVPPEIEFTALARSDGMDLRWNGLMNNDPDLDVFLFLRQIGIDWQSSQTLPPTVLRAGFIGDHTIEMTWDAVSTLLPGGFEVFYMPSSGGTWTSAGRTTGKDVLAMPVTGLTAGVSYDFTVATYTSPHADNDNVVLSEYGPVEVASTTDTGCAMPVIELTWTGVGATLSLTEVYTTYAWSTGAATPTILVNPGIPQDYWVTVTGPGACQESAIIFVDPIVFSDGFDLGNTLSWSATVP